MASGLFVEKKRKNTLYGIDTCIDDISVTSKQTHDALFD